ncbi:unnamed protein product [Closterium sp. NIES-53]
MRGWLLAFVCVAVSAVAQVAASPAVLFLDQTKGSYFNRASGSAELAALSTTATVAATAALLGVSVPPNSDADISAQLNSLLIPDPFNRPRSVFLLNLPGVDSSVYSNVTTGSVQVVQSRMLAPTSGVTAEYVADELEAEMIALYRSARLEGLKVDVATCGWKNADLDFAVESAVAASPCDNVCLELLMSPASVGDEASQQLRRVLNTALDANKDGDSNFLANLACVVRAMRSASYDSAEMAAHPHLLVASLAGFQEKQDPQVASARLAFVLATISAHMYSLRLSNKGSVVAEVVLAGASSVQAAPHLLLQQIVLSGDQRPGARQLRGVVAASQVAQAQGLETPAEVQSTSILVATVILLISSLVLATGYLFNMPLTRAHLPHSSFFFVPLSSPSLPAFPPLEIFNASPQYPQGHGGVMALFCKFPDPLSLDGGSGAIQPSSLQSPLLTPSNSYGAVLIAYESPTLMRARGFELLRSMSNLYQTLLTRPRFPLRRTTSSFLTRADGFKRGKLEAQMKDMCAAERGLRCSQDLRLYPMAPKAFLVRDSYQSAEDLAAIEALREEVEAKKERAKNMLEAELQFVNNMADDDICSLPGTLHLGESADGGGDGDGDSRRGGEAAVGSVAQSVPYNPDVSADSDDEHEDLVPKSMPGDYYMKHPAAEPAAAAPHGAVSRGGSSRALSFSLSFSHSRSRPREQQADVDDLASRVRALAAASAPAPATDDSLAASASALLSSCHSSSRSACLSLVADGAKLKRSGSHGSRSRSGGLSSRSFSFVHGSGSGGSASGTLSHWLRGNRGSLLPADAARVSPASDAAGGTAVSHSAELILGKRQGGEGGVEGGALGESLEEALAKAQQRAQAKEAQGHAVRPGSGQAQEEMNSRCNKQHRTCSHPHGHHRHHRHCAPQQQQGLCEPRSGEVSPRGKQGVGEVAPGSPAAKAVEAIAMAMRKKKSKLSAGGSTSPTSGASSSNGAPQVADSGACSACCSECASPSPLSSPRPPVNHAHAHAHEQLSPPRQQPHGQVQQAQVQQAQVQQAQVQQARVAHNPAAQAQQPSAERAEQLEQLQAQLEQFREEYNERRRKEQEQKQKQEQQQQPPLSPQKLELLLPLSPQKQAGGSTSSSNNKEEEAVAARAMSRKEQFEQQKQQLLRELQGERDQKPAKGKELPRIPDVSLMVPYPPSPIYTPSPTSRLSSVMDRTWIGKDKDKKRDRDRANTGWGLLFGKGREEREMEKRLRDKSRSLRSRSSFFVSERSKRAVPVAQTSHEAEAVNGGAFGGRGRGEAPRSAGGDAVPGSSPRWVHEAWAAGHEGTQGESAASEEGGGRLRHLFGGGWRR